MKKVLLILCLTLVIWGCKKTVPTYTKVVIKDITLSSLNNYNYYGHVEIIMGSKMIYRSNSSVINNGYNCVVNDGFNIDTTTQYSILSIDDNSNRIAFYTQFKTAAFLKSNLIKTSDVNINFNLTLQ